MPLDMTNDIIESVPANLDFGVAFENTKLADKKYVINDVTGEYLGIVGKDFPGEDHPTFFHKVQTAALENLSADEVKGANITWKTAKNNAWAMMDLTLPSLKTTITTPRHKTEVAQRIIALRAIDGSCSNKVHFGAIDFFCTNGIIHGEHDMVSKKNSSGFTIDGFIYHFDKAKSDFDAQTARLQHWADTSLGSFDVKDLLEKIIASESKAKKMYSLYSQESSVRGRNVFALYSAFTNYATYADERNGFNMRNTGLDTAAQTMYEREHEVSKWISTPTFKQLVAA